MPPPSGTPRFAYVIAALVGANLFLGFCYSLPAVYASVVSQDLGIPAQRVGMYTGLLVFSCMLGSLASSQWLRRYGALRMIQTGTLLQALGIGMGANASTVGMIASALVVGAGNGMVIPAVIHILARNAPPARLSISIALTQVGTSIGAALAGAILPSLLEAIAWRPSLLVCFAGGMIFVLAMQPLRGALDRDRDPQARLRTRLLFSPWVLALRDPGLRAVGIAALMLAFIASVYGAFIVNYLHLELKYSLVVAGLVLTVSNVGVVIGRLVTGWLADRLRDPLLVLRSLTLAAGLLTIASALLARGIAPFGLGTVVLTMTVCQAWFGVFLAAGARRAPAGKAAVATSGIQLFPIGASVIGPIVFSGLVSMLGSYSNAFLAFGSAGALFGVVLLVVYRGSAETRPA